jgi:hypothetical protein
MLNPIENQSAQTHKHICSRAKTKVNFRESPINEEEFLKQRDLKPVAARAFRAVEF